ncbi:hypothetical protein L207DRAFT_341839 [Hyaloscypha variabilis F]|uniref:REJ domain-containing protein n=1 Tax=Hyaloscypha variabilis (strain UAMH 11265 / GT02V1 / F) TaxID=1149755 RepID=A0A2J6RQ09_HYAVF|nr:hypothetical protein L207DRAFT_341839 [Hyaloscypha variabilis F]
MLSSTPLSQSLLALASVKLILVSLRSWMRAAPLPAPSQQAPLSLISSPVLSKSSIILSLVSTMPAVPQPYLTIKLLRSTHSKICQQSFPNCPLQQT